MIVHSTEFKATNIRRMDNGSNSLSMKGHEDSNTSNSRTTIMIKGQYHSREHELLFDFDCRFELNGSTINWGSTESLVDNKLSHIIREQCEVFASTVGRWDVDQ